MFPGIPGRNAQRSGLFRHFLGESGRPTVLVLVPQTVSQGAQQFIETVSCEDEPSVFLGFGVRGLCSVQHEKLKRQRACLGWLCPWRLSIDVQTCVCLWRIMWATEISRVGAGSIQRRPLGRTDPVGASRAKGVCHSIARRCDARRGLICYGWSWAMPRCDTKGRSSPIPRKPVGHESHHKPVDCTLSMRRSNRQQCNHCCLRA